MTLASIEHHLTNAFNNAELYLDDDNVLILLAAQDLNSLSALAQKLQVTESQLLSWLDSERPDISLEISQQLEGMTVEDHYIDTLTILAIGGLKALEQWQMLTNSLIEDACQRNLFDLAPMLMEEDQRSLCEQTLAALLNAGMTFPLDTNTIIENNHYTVVFSKIFEEIISLHNYYQEFFEAVAEKPGFELDYFHDWEEILVELAVYHALEEDLHIYPNLEQFKHNTKLKVYAYINALKCHAAQHRLPLRAELLHLLDKNPKDLYDYTEAEMMGLFPPRIHPDIYVNEMIESQRLLHKVLPALCLKCGMTEEELRNLVKE
ncbi:hypothetical protein BTO01_28855 [Vibrio jasicida]|uniref:hypothetical protein n=1 Tax=Vibrio jasicida TaxID=766224 RepID=UPI000CF4894D|nr:hypothetical protein [Vibrio jasicida]PQJ46837.1 hypothetical protein BTO01_28855 [Vibrio jasicida]